MTLPNHSGVSRETIDKLKCFESLVRKWTPRINLIAKSTVEHIWDRHIADCVQLFQYAPSKPKHWLDIGSGGGFPGIVMAIMSQNQGDMAKFTFVESDQRKATFLRTAARELELTVDVRSERVEEVAGMNADVITARALKSLDELLPFLHRHISKDGVAILPKGQGYAKEIAAVAKHWRFDLKEYPSTTEPAARVLVLKDISCD